VLGCAEAEKLNRLCRGGTLAIVVDQQIAVNLEGQEKDDELWPKSSARGVLVALAHLATGLGNTSVQGAQRRVEFVNKDNQSR
jgi:hypothetical protein